MLVCAIIFMHAQNVITQTTYTTVLYPVRKTFKLSLISNLFIVHQCTGRVSHTLVDVGAIRPSVTGPLKSGRIWANFRRTWNLILNFFSLWILVVHILSLKNPSDATLASLSISICSRWRPR